MCNRLVHPRLRIVELCAENRQIMRNAFQDYAQASSSDLQCRFYILQPQSRLQLKLKLQHMESAFLHLNAFAGDNDTLCGTR